ncbi:MAG: RrF2 family transcriptional regulator [Myxococcales bacterium]|jgi:Rrf2 family cysteine metabolism transcriptional repressor
MSLSKKCYYGLRALFELARHEGEAPLKIGQIAASQHAPVRFLEAILNQLKQGGFVQSRRGMEGGYQLARPASQITVGEVIRFIEGPLAPMSCPEDATAEECPFRSLWKRAEQALASVYDSTTFQDLVEEQRVEPLNFTI